nr:hypothetical protein Itr_chr15CG05720 [Ipomoea trifida]
MILCASFRIGNEGEIADGRNAKLPWEKILAELNRYSETRHCQQFLYCSCRVCDIVFAATERGRSPVLKTWKMMRNTDRRNVWKHKY